MRFQNLDRTPWQLCGCGRWAAIAETGSTTFDESCPVNSKSPLYSATYLPLRQSYTLYILKLKYQYMIITAMCGHERPVAFFYKGILTSRHFTHNSRSMLAPYHQEEASASSDNAMVIQR